MFSVDFLIILMYNELEVEERLKHKQLSVQLTTNFVLYQIEEREVLNSNFDTKQNDKTKITESEILP